MNGQLQLTTAKKALHIIYAMWSLHPVWYRCLMVRMFIYGLPIGTTCFAVDISRHWQRCSDLFQSTIEIAFLPLECYQICLRDNQSWVATGP